MTNANQYDPQLVDEYDYTLEAGPFRRFLWFCAGADEQLMKHCPHSERVKEEGIGGVVLSTAVLAFFSGSYALYTVFGPKVPLSATPDEVSFDLLAFLSAVLFGLIWALVIFNLDRFIVTSSGHGDGTSKITKGELIGALPRIAMAIVIGLSLSAPLEIRVFKSEIDAALLSVQQEKKEELVKDFKKFYDGRKLEVDTQIREIDNQLKIGRDNLTQQEGQLRTTKDRMEKEVTGGSGPKGYGPQAKALEEMYKRSSDKLAADKAEWAAKEQKFLLDRKLRMEESDRNEAEYKKQLGVSEIKAMSVDGLGKRIELAHELFPVSSAILILLLMIVETAPVFIKMMLVRGPYDLLGENQNQLVLAKFAIVEESTLEVGKDGKAVETYAPAFHQAEAIKEYERGKLQVEKDLARVAHETFREKVSQDIRINPDKYLSGKQKDAS